MQDLFRRSSQEIFVGIHTTIADRIGTPRRVDSEPLLQDLPPSHVPIALRDVSKRVL